MEKYSGFVDIDDELKWYAVVMSQGNIEAVSQFASYRNEMRTKNKIPVIAENGFSFLAGNKIPAIVKKIIENITDATKSNRKVIFPVVATVMIIIGTERISISNTCVPINRT